MRKKLAERFREAGGAAIEWQGKPVFMLYELPQLHRDKTLRVTFLKTSTERPQALRLKGQKGKISVNGQLLGDVILWSDTAPKKVEVTPQPSGAEMSVRIWNAWRDTMGVMQAWIGNAGMLVESDGPGTIILRCSDGYGDPTFDDLVVEVRVIQGVSGTSQHS